MKPVLISLAALAALSSAAFAGQNNGSPGDGVDTDAPRFFENRLDMSKPAAEQSLDYGLAVSNGYQGGSEPRPNYINPSQLH